MVVPAGAKVEDVVEAVPEKVKEEVAPVEVKQVSKKEKKKKTMDIQEVEVVPEPVEAVVEEPAPVPEEKVAVAEVKEAPIAVETVKNTKSSPSKQKTKKEKPVPTEVAAPAASSASPLYPWLTYWCHFQTYQVVSYSQCEMLYIMLNA